MIDQFITGVSREHAVPYALAIGAILLSMTLGYLLGKQDPAVVCADYILDANQLTEKTLKLNQQLTECDAAHAGKQVLNCGGICDKRVQEALKNHKNLICED